MEVNKIMNVVLPPVAIVLLLLFLPFYLVFKFIRYLKRIIYKEDVTGKAVLITGASSGVGEHLAYEYAKRGARLALVARREDRLQAVAKRASSLGSPKVIVISADVSKVEDCKTTNQFGRLDHLVNNAGIARRVSIGYSENLSDWVSIMDINFWGTVFGTHFAIPHLRKSKGKIIVVSSVAGYIPEPVSSIYNASKAALTSLFETLRIQHGSDIGITIVTPGFVESEITVDQGLNPANFGMGYIQSESTEVCAKAIVGSICRGDEYLTEPSWYRVFFLIYALCPEVFAWILKLGMFDHKED